MRPLKTNNIELNLVSLNLIVTFNTLTEFSCIRRRSFRRTAFNNRGIYYRGINPRLNSAHYTAFNPFAVRPEKHNWKHKQVKYGIGYQAAYNHNSQRL